MRHRWDPRAEGAGEEPACPTWGRDDLAVYIVRDENGRAAWEWECEECDA